MRAMGIMLHCRNILESLDIVAACGGWLSPAKSLTIVLHIVPRSMTTKELSSITVTFPALPDIIVALWTTLVHDT